MESGARPGPGVAAQNCHRAGTDAFSWKCQPHHVSILIAPFALSAWSLLIPLYPLPSASGIKEGRYAFKLVPRWLDSDDVEKHLTPKARRAVARAQGG